MTKPTGRTSFISDTYSGLKCPNYLTVLTTDEIPSFEEYVKFFCVRAHLVPFKTSCLLVSMFFKWFNYLSDKYPNCALLKNSLEVQNSLNIPNNVIENYSTKFATAYEHLNFHVDLQHHSTIFSNGQVEGNGELIIPIENFLISFKNSVEDKIEDVNDRLLTLTNVTQKLVTNLERRLNQPTNFEATNSMVSCMIAYF